MTDKITGPSGSGGSGSYPTISGPDRASRGAAPSTSARPAPATDETVSLTEDAALLRALDEQIATTPAVNKARVEEVRTALANGEYRVDAERIAQKLLDAEGGISSLLYRN